jgi:hypothetical protein
MMIHALHPYGREKKAAYQAIEKALPVRTRGMNSAVYLR